MRWKRWLIGLHGLLLTAGAGAGGLWWASSRPPEFYAAARKQERCRDPVEQQREADVFVRQTRRLVEEIRQQDTWSHEFPEARINAWLAEELDQDFGEWLPAGVQEPRVRILPDAIQVGFRYEPAGLWDDWNGVVSLRVRPWMERPNELAVRIESVQAGLVPVPLEQLLSRVADHLRNSGMQVEWRKQDGFDVALVRLTVADAADCPELREVTLRDGAVRVSGTGAARPGGIEFAPVRVASHSAAPPPDSPVVSSTRQ